MGNICTCRKCDKKAVIPFHSKFGVIYANLCVDHGYEFMAAKESMLSKNITAEQFVNIHTEMVGGNRDGTLPVDN